MASERSRPGPESEALDGPLAEATPGSASAAARKAAAATRFLLMAVLSTRYPRYTSAVSEVPRRAGRGRVFFVLLSRGRAPRSRPAGGGAAVERKGAMPPWRFETVASRWARSEEHTSEL